MNAFWRMLRHVFGRKTTDPDPEVQRAVSDSHAKASRTHQLLEELRSRTDLTRLERARLRYEERLHGTHRQYIP